MNWNLHPLERPTKESSRALVFPPRPPRAPGPRRPPARAAPPEPLDLLILNGKVLDGAGNPWFEHDIGVAGDRIAFVGHARAAGITVRETVDVKGLLITPGFVDMHSH